MTDSPNQPADSAPADVKVIIERGDPDFWQSHTLHIEIGVLHDDDVEYLLDLAVAAARAALRARGVDIDSLDNSYDVKDHPTFLAPDQVGDRKRADGRVTMGDVTEECSDDVLLARVATMEIVVADLQLSLAAARSALLARRPAGRTTGIERPLPACLHGNAAGACSLCRELDRPRSSHTSPPDPE
jgi:hypothetical protein